MNTNKTSLGNITFIMYKVIGGIKQIQFELEAISEQHSILVANDFYYKNGLIGRYYCETSNGNIFIVS